MLGGADASSIDVERPGCSRVGPIAPGLLVLGTVIYPSREDGQDDANHEDEEERFRVKRKCLLILLSYLVRLLLLQQLVHVVSQEVIVLLTNYGLPAGVT